MKKGLFAAALILLTTAFCSAEDLSFSNDTFTKASSSSWNNNLVSKYGNGIPNNSGRRSSSSSSSSHHHHHNTYTFGDFLIDIIDIAWLLNNISVEFDTYPYAHGNYLEFYFSTEPENFSSNNNSDYNETEPYVSPVIAFYRPYRFETEVDLIYMFNSRTPAASVRLEGFFWKFFGPVVEYTCYYNLIPSRHYPVVALSGDLRLGMQISIFHSNFLNFALAFEWDHKYGNAIGLYDGVAVELIFRSYPVSPLVFEDRIVYSGGNYRDCGVYENPSIIQNTFEVGFMIDNGMSITLSHRYLFNMYQNYIDNGVSVGFKYHF